MARAGIAKGSLYQYFDDKEDLYLYLINIASQEKSRFLAGQRPPEPAMGLFPYLRWMLETGAQFRFTQHKLERVVTRALSADQGLRSDVLRRLKEQSGAYWRQLVQMGMERGDVDAGFDPDLVAWVFSTLSMELGGYLLARVGAKEPSAESLADRYTSEAAPLFAELIRILEHGLRPR